MKKKIDTKELFNYLKKEKRYSSSDAIQVVQLAIYGKSFYTCLAIAESEHGENLMPIDCINILERVYGKKMQKMKPKTLFDKVYGMMKLVEGNPAEDIILDSVNYYLHV